MAAFTTADLTVAGTATGGTTNAAVLNLTGVGNAALVTFSGTFGTVVSVMQGSADGTNYCLLQTQALKDFANDDTSQTLTDNTTVSYYVPAAGMQKIRVYCSTLTTGTVHVDIRETSFTFFKP